MKIEANKKPSEILVRSGKMRSPFEVASLFCDSMVLQRNKRIPVWGWTKAGARVKVCFSGQVEEVTATAEGAWRMDLDPMEANAEGQQFLIESEGELIRLEDVLIGEVWVCSGQSNMEFTVSEGTHAERFIAQSEDRLLREFGVERATAILPESKVKGSWLKSCPEHTGTFTALGYRFACKLRRELGIPVGLIKTSWGGSSIEAWMSERLLLEDKDFDVVYGEWADLLRQYPENKRKYLAEEKIWNERREAALAAKEAFDEPNPWPPFGSSFSQMPTTLYNGMIEPLIPYAARGFLWYQGETNVKKPELYRKEFGAMIGEWRKCWEDEAMPFYFVQLASFNYENERKGLDWAHLRKAQEDTLSVPHTGMVVSMDLVDDLDDIHPVNKHDLGDRMAALALSDCYGKDDLQSSGPVPMELKKEGSSVLIEFSKKGGALVLKETEDSPMEISEDGVHFVPATARKLSDYRIECSAESVLKPKAVRYAYYNAPVPNLFDESGWPVAQFWMEV